MQSRKLETKKANQMKTVETTKEAIKTRLEASGKAMNEQWHSQQAHRGAVFSFFADAMELKPEQRKELQTLWFATPASFGANASALGQALGRESGKAKIEKLFDL